MYMLAVPKYRAIVAHYDPNEQRRISRLLEETKLFEVILTTCDGEDCVRCAINQMPDLVIAETTLTGIDGLEVLRRLKAACCTTKILILTSHVSFINNDSVLSEADYAILAPYEAKILVERSLETVRGHRKTFSAHLIHTQTTTILANLEAPLRLKGYPYVSDAVQLVVLDSNILYNHTSTNGLYSLLCRRHGVTYKNVERCMRSFGERLFRRSPLKVMEQYFDHSDIVRGRISNLALISVLASKVTEALEAMENTEVSDN